MNGNGFAFKSHEVESFITDDRAAAQMVRFSERLGSYLKKNKLTTSQIRNAYGNLKKLEMAGWKGASTQRHVLLLKPRLAYAAGRHRGGLKDLREVLDVAIDKVEDETSFNRFCQFFEAILAYHKAAGGK